MVCIKSIGIDLTSKLVFNLVFRGCEKLCGVTCSFIPEEYNVLIGGRLVFDKFLVSKLSFCFIDNHTLNMDISARKLYSSFAIYGCL